jgi:phosphate transport system permease protein
MPWEEQDRDGDPFASQFLGAQVPPPYDPSAVPPPPSGPAVPPPPPSEGPWSVPGNGAGNGSHAAGNGNGSGAAGAARGDAVDGGSHDPADELWAPVATLTEAPPVEPAEFDPLDAAALQEGRSTAPDLPRTLVKFSTDDAVELGGSFVAGLMLTWLFFYRLTPLYGATGFVLVTFLIFIVIYWVVVRQNHGKLAAGERVSAVIMGTAALAAVVPLGLILFEVVAEGIKNLRLEFFTETQQDTGPLDPATKGGALHAIVGTLQQVGIATLISVPLAVLTAVFLNEIGGRFARVVRFIVDTMSGTPSIVAGLFIYSILILGLGWGFSGFAGALALTILMLPTITRTTEEMLRLVSSGLREAALALGAPEWRVTTQVVLPTARTGIATAVILGIARAIGETAPVLLTSFGASVMNWNAFSGAQSNLPLFIYSAIRSSQDNQVARAWTGALVLMALVLILFIIARILGGKDQLRR